MQVDLIATMSIDGKITKGEDTGIRSWTSKEDVAFFRNQVADHDVIVMGRKTYRRERLWLRPNKLFVILTTTPDLFSDFQIEGQLEFVNENPGSIVKRLESEGHSKLLLVGGGYTNAGFLKLDLVDEFYITIEPLVFGQGLELFSGKDFGIKLSLQSIEQLNTSGTLLLHYSRR